MRYGFCLVFYNFFFFLEMVELRKIFFLFGFYSYMLNNNNDIFKKVYKLKCLIFWGVKFLYKNYIKYNISYIFCFFKNWKFF